MRRLKVSFIIGLVVPLIVATTPAFAWDGLYKTGNTPWDCPDGNPGEGYCQTDNASYSRHIRGLLNRVWIATRRPTCVR